MDRVADLSQDLQNLLNVRLIWIVIRNTNYELENVLVTLDII